MRGKRVRTVLCVTFGAGALLPLLVGQQPVPAPGQPVQPAAFVRPAAKRDLTKLSLVDREAYLSGQRGMEWLQRFNKPDGHFVSGYLPAVRSAMEGESWLQQAQAVLALARAARYYNDANATARARQAMLTLLVDTTVEPNTTSALRHTTMPSALVNRLAAAGILVQAIHELPAPGADLLEQASQLCQYLLSQQRADGSLMIDQEKQAADADPAGVKYCIGPALHALALGKTDAVRKAHAVYAKWWREHKNPAMIPEHTAACAEAYLKTRAQAFADTVFEMNDWLCTLQHQQVDPRHPLWRGGFKNWRDGRETSEPPEINSAAYAESLVQACRVARQAGDVRRSERYNKAVQEALQFLATLQYTEASTQHFATWYRPYLLGAFHASHQDGNLRLDDTSRAVAALVLYLETR